MQERRKEKRRNFSAVTRVKILGYADEHVEVTDNYPRSVTMQEIR
jgi:hypothetical protein